MNRSATAPAHASEPPRWRLRLLGAVELLGPAGVPVRLPTRAVTLLLARMALAPGRQHPREELIDLLWPSADRETGRNRLRQALSVLRSLLEPAEAGAPADAPSDAAPPPVLHADRRAVWLARGALACDADAFVQALASGLGERAAGLYQGELLPGFFDEWVIELRSHLAAKAEALAARAAVPGDGARPLAVPAAALPDARLPRYLTRLFGHEGAGGALSALASLLARQRLVVLRGPGGAGKTRLAVEVARASALAPHAGGPAPAAVAAAGAFELVAFVPLASCSDRVQMLDVLLHSLGQEGGADADDAARRVAGCLAGRRVLLVLDNFEQLVEAGRADLARWLSALPLLHLLVTSRRVLGLDGEAEYLLSPWPLPLPADTLDAHARNASVALFVDRARAARPDFALGEHNHQPVAAIVRALHGLPLAIELAAARVRSLGLAEMLAMLQPTQGPGPSDGQAPALALLARSGPRAPEDARHASMLRVLQWSWQQLSPDEQALLAALAACDGGASLQLVAQLVQVPLVEAALRVDGLVAASVAYEHSDRWGGGRYQVFEPMREFIFLQAGAPGVAQLRAAHAQAVAAWAAAHGAHQGQAALRAEWGNLLRALATGADAAVPAAPPQQAIDTVLLLRQALEDLSLPPSALDHLRTASQASDGHQTGPVQALLAVHSFEAGQREAAGRHAAAAWAAAAETPPELRAQLLRCVARVKMRLGDDLAEVLALADGAIALARQHGQMFELGSALSTRGVLLLRRDRDHEAHLARARELLTLRRAHGPAERVSSSLIEVALALGFLHRVPEQLVLLEETRALSAQLGQHRLLAFTTSVTGYALADLGRYAESAAQYRECLQMSWDSASWREWFYALWNLPRTLVHLRRPGPAAQLMGFAEAFYAARFGQLGPEDLPEARRTRRLAAALLGAEATAGLWRQGAAMGMGQAMQLALAHAAPAGG
jgi:predicted ATPase